MGAWINPVPGSRLTAHYGQAGSAWSSGYHTGQDFAAPRGTTVVAVAAGTVKFVGYKTSYGRTVIIDHGNGLESWYAHLQTYSVTPLRLVKQGTQIGTVGDSGNAFGTHTHLEARVNGKHRDPMPYISGSATPVAPIPPGAPATPVNPGTEKVEPAVDKITSPDTWKRVGYFIGGAAGVAMAAYLAVKAGVL